MLDPDSPDQRSLPRRSLVTANLARSIDRPRTGAGLLVFLVSIGFIGAAIISAFAIAAFSSLYPGNETQTRSSAVGWSEVNSIRPDPSPSTDGNAAPVKLGTTPSITAAPRSAPERPPAAEAAMPEAPIPETTQLQPAGQPSSSSEGVSQPTAKVEHNDATTAPPFAGEAVDRLFREFRSQQYQQVEPDPGIATSAANTAAPGV